MSRNSRIWRGFLVAFCCHSSLITHHSSLALTPGQTGHAFLKIPVSARALALGEAFVGFGGDAAGMDYGPAGLAALGKVHLSASAVEYFDDAGLSAVYLAGRAGNFAAGVYGRQFAAGDEGRTAAGPAGEIRHRDSVTGLCVAYRLGKLALGVGAKSISRSIESSETPAARGFEVTSTAWAADAGLFFTLANRSTLAFALQNMGPPSRFEFSGPAAANPFGGASEGSREALPLALRLGGVHPLGRLGFAWEMTKPREERVAGSAGVEVPLSRHFMLRAGLRHQRFVDVGLGFGVTWGTLGFDYGFSPRVDLGNVHRATLGVKF